MNVHVPEDLHTRRVWISGPNRTVGRHVPLWGIVPTENSILLKKRKRQARGNEICRVLRLLTSHCWIHELSAAWGEAQIDCGA
jgi:hypothetical protein